MNAELNQSFKYIESATGSEKILVRILNEENGSKTTFLILHDYFDYHKYYLETAERLFKDFPNSRVVLFDYKGLGRSSGDRGYIKKWNVFTLEAKKVIEAYANTEKLVVIGSGLGGVVALDLLFDNSLNLEKRIDGVCLINPLLKMIIDYPNWAQSVIRNFPSFLERARFPIRFNYHRFCTDFEHSQVVNADALVPHDVSFRTIIELLETNNRLKSLSYFIKKPTLIMLSEKGHLCHNEFIKVYAKGVDRKYLTLNEYKGAYHDLIHDRNSEQVVQDLVDWAKEVL